MRYWCILKNARAALILLSVEFSFTEDITVFNKKNVFEVVQNN